MDDDDPHTVRRMLSYLYTLDYSDERLPDDAVQIVVPNPAPLPHLRQKILTTTGGEARSGKSSLEVDVETWYDPKRLNNLLVYAIADKYDIPELKELAKCKFQALAKNKWESIEFKAVKDAVFGATTSQDTGLQQILSQICIDHFEDIIKDTGLLSVVLSNQELAHALLQHAMREKTNDMQLLDQALSKQSSMQEDLSQATLVVRRALDQEKQKVVVLQSELAKAKAETERVRNQMTKIESELHGKTEQAFRESQKTTSREFNLLRRLDALVENANKWEECRNCGDEFGSWIERLGSLDDPQFQLRCSNCRCRHSL